ncbi:hypothetical protein [Vulcanococcus limneticus]|jgi:hypothetical protein|uniref:hypothetical protein n=1 Tax=Vulcanococcus limneticus TaxID=2170428 RepID=UPI00398BBCEB
MLEGGHEQVVEFRTLDDFQKWYGGVLTSAAPDAFVNVPLDDLELEYLVLRASSVIAIRVEPLFASVQD